MRLDEYNKEAIFKFLRLIFNLTVKKVWNEKNLENSEVPLNELNQE